MMVKRHLNYGPLDFEVHTDSTISCKSEFDELVKENSFSVVMVNSGSLNIRVHHVKVVLYANDLIAVPMRVCRELLSWSDEARISVVSFSLRFIFNSSVRKPPIGYFEIFLAKNPGKVSLKKEQATALLDVIGLLEIEEMSAVEYEFKKEIIVHGFNLFLYRLVVLYQSHSWKFKIKQGRKEMVVVHFFKALEENCRKEHGVQFYADTLLMTSGHLAKVIKGVTDKGTKQHIEESIIYEAKILLENNDLTILDIVEELQFKSAQSFSGFFKKHTSLSPTEYRLKGSID
jgi:AraC family transcriptional activator of pobA